jgi:tRNA(Ile)-lysidine synthase
MAATRNSRPTELVEAVAACLSPRLPQGRRVCVALSGGRDSVALLHVLAELRASRFPELSLSALHVHHGLSAHADAWADFCAGLCERLQISLSCMRVTVDRSSPAGLEAAARAARYAAFDTVDADWLLLAHHRDDQAETLLLNLLRGAGAHGLAAMPEARLLREGLTLLRPLLPVPRAAIEDWLRTRGLAWIDDDSNSDSTLRRNFLRLRAMPLLADAFPAPAAALARAAGHLGELAALADEAACADAKGIVDGESLHLPPFNALTPARRANLLRFFLRRVGARMPDCRHLAEMLRQLAAAGQDTQPVFRVDGVALQVSRGRLWLLPCVVTPAAIAWSGESTLPWAGGIVRFNAVVGRGIAADVLAGAELRPRCGGERLRPDPKRPRRPLKKLLQESGMPQWQRDAMPLLWCGDTLLWAGGVGTDCDAPQANEAGAPGWELVWEPVPEVPLRSDG